MIDIILLGWFVNLVSGILFVIFMSVLSIGSIANNPTRILELQQMENDLSEYKRLIKMAPFQEKYIGTIAFILPFATLLKHYMLLKSIVREGGMPAYIQSEINRLRILIEEKEK